MTKTNDLKDAIRLRDGKPLPVLLNHYPSVQEYNYCPWYGDGGPCQPDEYTVAVWYVKPKEVPNAD